MSEADKKKPKVYVFGGGISGLTAAHELVIRGFEVHLYEKASSVGPRGQVNEVSLGGMARTQYFETDGKHRLYYRDDRGPLGGQGVQADQYFPEVWLEFEETGYGPTDTSLLEHSLVLLKSFLDYVIFGRANQAFVTPMREQSEGHLLVQIFYDPDSPPQIPKPDTQRPQGKEFPPSLARAYKMAEKVEEEIKNHNRDLANITKGPKTHPRECILRPFSGLGSPPVARNWVRVLYYRLQLPGEHGYRFFPSYYRHVFDTMERIPRQSEQGEPSGGSVLDNLVPLDVIGLTSTKHAPLLLRWSAPARGSELYHSTQSWNAMQELGARPQDVLQFSLRVWRYMLSCPRRRAHDLKDQSWWEYLEGRMPDQSTALYHYSPAFSQLLKSSSRILAAMDGERGDARVCGDTYMQLLTEALVPTTRGNCTLDAPTSEAWFRHWQKHLERLGVEFHRGELCRLVLDRCSGQLLAKVHLKPKQDGECEEGAKTIGNEEGSIYFVVATDLPSAARTTKGLPGIPEQLQDYAFRVPQFRGDAHGYERKNPEDEFVSRSDWDRFQMISGIQFFFEKQVSVVDGYLYCVDSEWGLSAICSQIAWEERPIQALSAYESILSVDIGNWMALSRTINKAAWECKPEELKKEVLRQLRASLSSQQRQGHEPKFVLPDPDWVHIDENLVFRDEASVENPLRLKRNNTPYLVPLAGDWKNRPGPEPWDPTPNTAPPPPWHCRPAHVWQATHGGYPIHHGRLVFAGTWLRTFTRMTTMESANESARHAVNAILDHEWHHRPRPPSGPGQDSIPGVPDVPGFYPTTPRGDYCRIWDPELNELPDVSVLRQQDEVHFDLCLPHVFDLLGLEILPSLLSRLGGVPSEQLLQWVGSLGTSQPGASRELLTMLRHVRQLLESMRPPPR